MSTAQRLLLAVLALLLLAGLGAGALWLLDEDEPAEAIAAPGPDGPPAAPAAVERDPGRLAAGEAAPERAKTSQETTVAYPLEVVLELERPGRLPEVAGVPAWGTSGRASLTGFVFDGNNQPLVGAELEFLHGANTGRVLTTSADGAYGASDLQPGLSIVRLTGPGVLGSMREVLLRQERETVLTIGYARPARISGEVIDREGKPLEGARVTLDGLVAVTDSFGQFHFPQVASGDALVVVEKTGFRSYREILPVTHGASYEIGRLRYAMEPGASLEIVVPERMGGGEEAYVYFFSKLGVQRDYPWFLVNPTRVWPGGRVRVDDLPQGRIDLRLYHAGARAVPELAVANLVPGSLTTAEIHLRPAPMLTGVVRAGGKPVAGARVTLEAADRVDAVLAALGEEYGVLEGDVLPGLPPGVQTTTTNGAGEYVLSAWSQAASDRYLTAVGPDGASFAGQLLRGEEENVDLELKPRGDDDGEIRLRMGGRYQALPVALRVRGQPRERFLLAPDDDLVIEDLAPGTWTMKVRWNREWLVKDARVEVPNGDPLDVALPLEAIEGQTDEIHVRAGRE